MAPHFGLCGHHYQNGKCFVDIVDCLKFTADDLLDSSDVSFVYQSANLGYIRTFQNFVFSLYDSIISPCA